MNSIETIFDLILRVYTKMAMLSRQAYGLRNFENNRIRVLAHCAWDGIVNRA